MTSNIYGASNLQFLGNRAPDNLIELHADIKSMIDNKISEPTDAASEEDTTILQNLRSDISDVEYKDFIDLNYPKFSITPHEIDWLQCHKKSDWIPYLIHRYKFKIYPTQKILSDFPVHLLLEPTPVCNLRCIMCFQVAKSFSSDRKHVGYMKWDLFTSVIDQAADHQCHAITLASRGEPTLHKRFGEMLRYIHDKKLLDVKINTNATRLDEKLCHDILSANVSTVTLSVDAADKDTYERIRVLGKFDQVLQNIELFHNIRDKHYPDSTSITRISGVAVDNTQSPEQMQSFWSKYVDQVSIRQEIPRWDSYGNPQFNRNDICNLLYERIYVWYDGICNPCDFDYKSFLKLGNANENSISDIWLGNRYQDLRDAHENNQRSCTVPCDRCPF